MIKRYFIVVLLLSLLPAGVSAQRRAAAKKDWKYGHEIEMYTVEQGEKRDKRQ